MDYAIIRLGGKQYRVREGETLVVDRLGVDQGKTFQPDVLLGEATVTATVVAHERGPKIRIGKLKRRTGYRRHNGFRAATSRIEISLGGAPKAAARKAAPPVEKPAPVEKPVHVEEAAPVDEAPSEVEDHVKGMPHGYEEMTVVQVSEGSKTWNRPMLEAALAYEQAHAARKGALTAIEHALKAKEDSH
jgi:large subunit ribosomal protein L21